MRAPFATACVLSFNRLEFLQQMLGTMITFAGHPLEIIVHDDGTDDPHQRMYLHHMVEQGLISTLIANPPGHNQGQGVALNRMFRMASGDPIIKLDHDLIFREGWLRRVVDILENNHQSQFGPDGPIEPRLGALGLFKYHADPVHHEKMHVAAHDGWDQVQDFVGSAIAVPRHVWESEGPFEEHSEAFAEDFAFKMKAKGDGLALGITQEDLVINQGFGVGPSTLVLNDNHDLRKIHKEPKIIYPKGVRA